MSFGKPADPSSTNPYAAMAQNYVPAAQASVADRLSFIRKTYLHLAGAVFAFVILETVLYMSFGEQIMTTVLPRLGGAMWLVVLAAFMGASFLAQRWASSDSSRSMQYLGLGLYVLAWTAIFLPIIALADTMAPGAIQSAAIITAVVFAGLTLTVFVTQVDFSFLRTALIVGSIGAFAAILVGILMPGLNLFGVVFAGAMVVLAAGYILYDTSNVLHHYRTDQYVAAALALFSGVAMLFWYILQLVMLSRD